METHLDRKKRQLIKRHIVFYLLLMFGLAFTNQQAAAIGGAGTSASPYIINSAADWTTFRNNINGGNSSYQNKYWILTADISIAGTEARVGYGGSTVPPISTAQPFIGSFDGQNHTITVGGTYSFNGTDYVGLFGLVDGTSTIKDLNLEMGYLDGRSYVGYLIGGTSGNSNTAITISNVQITADPTVLPTYLHNECWGGLIGHVSGGNINISSCSVTGKVCLRKTGAVNAGGLIGCIVAGVVTAKDCLANVIFSYYSTSITPTSIGGFLGYYSQGLSINLIRCVTHCIIPNIDTGQANNRGTYIGCLNANYVFPASLYSPRRAYKGITGELLTGSGTAGFRSATITGNLEWVDWKNNARVYDFNRLDDLDATIATTACGVESWGYGSDSLPKVSKTGYAVMVKKGPGIGSASGYRFTTNNKYFVNADEPLTITPSGTIDAHTRVTYTFDSIFAPRSGGASYTANVVGNSWVLYAKADGTVNANVEKIPYPQSLSAEFDQWANKVTLSWTNTNTNEIRGLWYVYRRQGTGTWTLMNSIGTSINTAKAKETYTFDHSITTSGDYNKIWEYAVLFVEATSPAQTIPSDPTTYKYKEISNYATKAVDLTINIPITSFTAVGQKDGIAITAQVPAPLSNSTGYNYSILKKLNTGSFTPVVDKNSSFPTNGTITYIDKAIDSSCDSITYRLDIAAFDKTFSSPEASARITGGTKLASIKATKGEYNNQVRVAWESTKDARDASDRYKVFRRVANNPKDVWTDMATINTTEASYIYSDDKAMPGVYYEYRVTLYQSCSIEAGQSETKELESIEDIGFSQSSGTVSGRVTYGSGQSVKEVGVSVKRNDLQENESQYLSLKSTGDGNYFSWSPDSSYYDIVNGTFTYQFWLRPAAGMAANTKIGEIGDRLNIMLSPDAATNRYKILLGSYSTGTNSTTYLTTTTGISPNRFSHITIVSDGTNLTCYIVNDEDLSNAQLIETKITRTLSTTKTTTNRGIRMGYAFKGNIDECRLWSRALTAEEIKRDYNRMLTGGESELKAYWTFDEGLDGRDGQQGYFFDISRLGTVYNNNHGRYTLSGDTIVPTDDQLALKAITDANGNYQIRGIPFSGEGTSYDIVPTLGVHKFNPTSQLRYISGSSLVHNATDFTDISSFDVRGEVIYEGGDYPVENCNFEIDGKPVINPDGTPYVNDSEGEFTISVPIGEHTVRVVKTGHTFVNDGYLTMPEGGYNKPESGRTFYDKTLVKLIGRVAGGLTENDKPLGFGESVNNTGASTITLTAAKEYDLQTNSKDTTFRHNNGQWKKPGGIINEDTTHVRYNPRSITITISPATGEFVAWVYPEAYTVGVIEAPGYTERIYDKNEPLDLTATPVPNDDMLQTSVRTWTDSTLVNRQGQVPYYEKIEKSDTVRYNEKRTFLYQAVPTFSVTQLSGSSPVKYFGEKEYTIEDALTGSQDIVTLWDESNNPKPYLFDKPVFKQGNKYTFLLKAYEQYVNNVDPNIGTISYPVTQGKVYMSNTIALTEPDEITLDETGEAKYTFTAGAPDITTGLHSFMGTIDIGEKRYYWDQGKDGKSLEVWHLGDRTTGTDFMTSGPNQLTAILRDPPGSLSSAFIEKGSTVTMTSSNEIKNGLKEALDATVSFGPRIVTFAGIGFGVITEAETTLDVAAGVNSEQTWSSSTKTSQTTTFTERFQTSDDPSFVSHAGDLFIGNSTNIQYGLTNGISIQKNYSDANSLVEAGNYSIAPSTSIAYGQTFETAFLYTQMELENIMIPKWKENLALLLRLKEKPVSEISYPVYVSNLDDDDENFGKLNTDKEAFGDRASTADKFYDGPSYTIVFPDSYDMAKFKEDSVMWFNNQINSWTAVLAQNEKEKVEMTKLGNYSFGGGGSVDWSKTETSSKSTTSTFHWMLNPTIGLTVGGDVMGIGLELETTVEYVHESDESSSVEKATSLSTGFTLKEEGINDEITVDYGLTSSGTIAFKTRGGRTSCPYEQTYVSKYYQPGQYILSEGTMQIEVPVIDVNGPDQVLNVPANKPATFVLDLKNESETNKDTWLLMTVDEKTNPNGAELKIDGGVVGNGRMFLVKAGEVLKKTLTVTKGTADVYNKIGIILGSECQYMIADTTYVSVEFVPSCSEVNIKAPTNNWIVNTNTGDTLRVVLDGFDRNFANFGYIKLEARKASSPDWTQLMCFYADPAIYDKATGQKTLITSTDVTIIYDWAMKNNEDAAYELRATAVCVNKDANGVILSTLSEYTTNIVTGTKDMARPESLGLPSPVNGILAAGDEISITFNENIQTGMLTKNNFKISGALNASIIAEPNTGLYFTGTGSAYTELPIATNGSFSIETNFKRVNGTAGTLFTYGANDEFISLGFDATGHAVVTIGDETETSTNIISNTTNTWKYVGLAYNRNDHTVSVYAFQDSDPTINLFVSKPFTNEPPTQGKLYVGNLSDGSAGFQGAVGRMHFYDVAHTVAEMNLTRSTAKSGTEPNLIDLWEMNEAEGKVAKDKARNRNLVVNTDWYIYPAGKSLSLNGTSQYATIPSGTFPFRYFDDFTIEMQFKGATQNAVTLLSVGMTAYIEFDADHKLVLNAGGNTQVLTSNNLLDNNWHHLALSVKRNGMATAIIDGVAATTFNSSILNGDVAGGFYFLGVHYDENKTLGTYEYTQYFKGNIDEVRVWNSALITDLVNQNKKFKLHGNEVGLVSYLPFEAWEKLPDGTTLVSVLANDLVDRSRLLDGTYNTSDVAASVIDAPVKETIGNDRISYVASDNKIVLTIDEEASRLEGVTLDISVEGVQDMRGNVSKPAKWIAYVNRNPLNWVSDPANIIMQYGETKTFKASIQNGAGVATDYYIQGLPNWLSVNAPSGTLQPLSTEELTFTVSKSINIGSYEASIVLTGVNNIQKPLPVTLKVTGVHPDWSVDLSNFEQLMTVTGLVQIEGIPQEDEADILAAFIDGQCVGLASPKYEPALNAYFTYMMVGGNEGDDSKEVTFKLWDASTGNVYPVIELTELGSTLNLKFIGDDSHGTAGDPVYFNAQNVIEQSINLNAGWNWISVNVIYDNPVLLEQFKANTVGYAAQVKSGDAKFLNNNGGWAGTLLTLDIDKMYVVNSNQTATLKMIGTPAKPAETPIILAGSSWSWIGYAPQFSLSVSEALAGISAPVLNDQVKSMRGYRILSSVGWIGSLNVMEPGLGYKYKSGNAQNVQFKYPNASMMLRSSSEEWTGDYTLSAKWNVDYTKFSENMTITSSIFINNNEITNGLYEVAAFSNGECRGDAVMQYVDGFAHPYMGFLMVYGEKNENIEFRIFDHETRLEYKADETLPFSADAIYGTPDELFKLRAGAPTGMDAVNDAQFVIFPNPVEKELFIRHNMGVLERVEFFDINGRLLLLKENFTGASIDVSSLKDGSYFIHITSDGQRFVNKFIKK